MRPDNQRLPDLAIYLDLDGVMADFDAGLRALGFDPDPALNRSREELDADGQAQKERMYDLIREGDFYARLPLMAGAERLWSAVADLDPVFLTAAPRFGGTKSDPAFQNAARHKRAWVDRQAFGPVSDDRFICTTSREKALYVGYKPARRQVLIDDRESNTRAWADAGGLGILHTSVEDTLEALHLLCQSGPMAA
ncbi:hypothetical protein CKO28_00855 [Rhodovibrio sodomensis]|uniref:Haloacid dehalogenase n=1 Tax=Rhodovibrio sodomensis TaxID=1088 RepID=A0ABS1D9L9_9PROT|nr:hypothetical protein [Rhodovibrio sodomensis]MBK1666591.1 hypothetical protein [Rhodovibrio sodomensis]